MRPRTLAPLLLLAASGLAQQANGEPKREPPPRQRAPEPAAELPAAGDLLTPDVTYPQRLHLKQHADAVAAIDRGLRWLRGQQQEDGRWSAGDEAPGEGDGEAEGENIGGANATYDVARTGLAILALSREGPPPQGDPDRAAIGRAAAWLIRQQGDDGLLGTRATIDYIYGHAIGTLGLLAAAAATDATDPRDAAATALGYLERHRNPYMAWRYQPRDGDNDMSVTAWCSMACCAGRQLGLEVTPQVFHEVAQYLEQLTDAEGRTGYSKKGERSSRNVGNHAMRFPPNKCETLTAAALLCRFALQKGQVDDGIADKASDLLLARPPVWDPDGGAVDQLYWFFGSEALRRVGGEPRTKWQRDLVTAALAGQAGDDDRDLAGSWPPVGPWGAQGGRVYSTALMVMALQGLYPLPAD